MAAMRAFSTSAGVGSVADVAAGHEVRLRRYAASIVHDVQRAEDVVQDVLCRLIERPTSAPDDASSLRAWLFASVRNRCIDVLRKEGRMKALAELDDDAVGSPTPASLAETQDEADRALAALDQLPASQRACLRLRFSGNMSYREISEATGKSVNHVGVLIHEGLKTLRSQLIGDLADGGVR
ncbi:MAG: sigma-70 family RNA polymerase sigma factor [Planctomycetota bacterium]